MNKKIIVSGVTGQDGSYMIEYLLENTQDTIIAAIRRTSQAILSNLQNVIGNPRVKLVTMDLNDPHSIEKVIKEEKPDYFINFGGQSFVADSWASPALHMQTNALSLIHILESVYKHVPTCRVYSAGSSEQWGDVKYSPQDEKHPMSPRSIYGVSKCTASLICKVYRESYNMYVVHGILLNHESERRQDYFVSRKITKGVARIHHALKNNVNFDPIQLGNINAKRDFSHAKDFMDGIWRMLNQEEFNKTLNIAQGEEFIELYNQDKNKLSMNAWLSKLIKEYVLSSNETHEIREFIELAFAEAGIKGVWWPGLDGKPESEEYLLSDDGKLATKKYIPLVIINPKFYRPADVELLWGNSDLIRKELGWSPKISFNQLVTKMVKHDIEHYEITN